MIVSYNDEASRSIWEGTFSKKFKLPAKLQNIARRKLRMIDAATSIEILKIPPNNRLEQLTGNRKSQWRIRINEKYRICFFWKSGNVSQVEIVDYRK